MNKKKLIAFLSVTAVLISTALWTVWGNIALECNTYTVKSYKLPKAFDSMRIVQISDLHNAEIGKNNEKLISVIEKAEPDIVVFTGDSIDSRRTDIETALSFIKYVAYIAPCYYVTGNHESRVPEYSYMKKELVKAGVTVLDDEQTVIEREGESIKLMGVNDPDFETDYFFASDGELISGKLKNLKKDDDFTILLSHRPELFSVYVENEIDLVFSGHAHGGQFRLPFAGGVFAPHQGFLPEFDGGIYTENGTTMIVSRGIGNSLFPLRFNNRPEVIVAVIRSEN